MPWVKGQSGNPKGASPRRNAFARMVRDSTKGGQDLVDFAVQVLGGQHGAELPERLDAMKWLADRGFGKAVETVVIEDERDNSLPPPTMEALESVAGAPSGPLQ